MGGQGGHSKEGQDSEPLECRQNFPDSARSLRSGSSQWGKWSRVEEAAGPIGGWERVGGSHGGLMCWLGHSAILLPVWLGLAPAINVGMSAGGSAASGVWRWPLFSSTVGADVGGQPRPVPVGSERALPSAGRSRRTAWAGHCFWGLERERRSLTQQVPLSSLKLCLYLFPCTENLGSDNLILFIRLACPTIYLSFKIKR